MTDEQPIVDPAAWFKVRMCDRLPVGVAFLMHPDAPCPWCGVVHLSLDDLLDELL